VFFCSHILSYSKHSLSCSEVFICSSDLLLHLVVLDCSLKIFFMFSSIEPLALPNFNPLALYCLSFLDNRPQFFAASQPCLAYQWADRNGFDLVITFPLLNSNNSAEFSNVGIDSFLFDALLYQSYESPGRERYHCLLLVSCKYASPCLWGRCENPECQNITEYGGISRNMAEYHGIWRNNTEYHDIFQEYIGTSQYFPMVAMRLFNKHGRLTTYFIGKSDGSFPFWR
jgi:hypothetical protein